MTDRDSLLRAIDRLAAAAEARDLERIRRRHADARALVLHILPAPAGASPQLTCPTCGLACNSRRRLEEHCYQVHAGPTPEHWIDPEDAYP